MTKSYQINGVTFIVVEQTKGGVTKSFTTGAVAHKLALETGTNVLIADLDVNGHSSSNLNVSSGPLLYEWLCGRNVTLNTKNVLVKEPGQEKAVDYGPVVMSTGRENLYILRGNATTAYIDGKFMNDVEQDIRVYAIKNPNRTRMAVDMIKERLNELFDYVCADGRGLSFVVMDCPPGLTLVAQAFMEMADFAIIPTGPDTNEIECAVRASCIVDDLNPNVQKIILPNRIRLGGTGFDAQSLANILTLFDDKDRTYVAPYAPFSDFVKFAIAAGQTLWEYPDVKSGVSTFTRVRTTYNSVVDHILKLLVSPSTDAVEVEAEDGN